MNRFCVCVSASRWAAGKRHFSLRLSCFLQISLRSSRTALTLHRSEVIPLTFPLTRPLRGFETNPGTPSRSQTRLALVYFKTTQFSFDSDILSTEKPTIYNCKKRLGSLCLAVILYLFQVIMKINYTMLVATAKVAGQEVTSSHGSENTTLFYS